MPRYDIDRKPESLAELEPMILLAQEELSALCHGKRFRMSVPVDSEDSDMVIGDALRHSLAFVRAALGKAPSGSKEAPPANQDVLALIRRVVTGDGAQLENLDLTDEEWRCIGFDTYGPDFEEHFEITVRFDDWLAMVRLVRVAASVATPARQSTLPERLRQLAIGVKLDMRATDVSGCLAAVARVGWPEPPRSRCSFCPNQSDAEWLELTADEFTAACDTEDEIRAIDPHAFFHKKLIPLREVTLDAKADNGGLFGGCSAGTCY